MKKLLLTLPAVLLLTGCSLFESSENKTAAAPNEPIKVEMEITERSSAPAEEAAPKAEKKAEKKKSKAATPASTQERVELPPEMSSGTSFDSELNDVERGYMDSIRKKNKKSREESSRSVFGGWL